MHENETVILSRDVEAAIVPAGNKVTLQKGEQAHITQSLGGTYTVVVNGNMFRIVNRDADALGFEVAAAPENLSGQPRTKEELEKEVWNLLKTCYDPEIPVNIVDLGLRLRPRNDSGGQRLSCADQNDVDRARLRHGAGDCARRA